MQSRRHSMILVVMVASASLFGIAPTQAQSVPVEPCPVVVENTTLKTDCVGPMLILADDVNVNLATHQVTCNGDTTRTGIVLVNRTDVRIENGHVHACGRAILAHGGGGNHLTKLHLDGNICLCTTPFNRSVLLLQSSHDNVVSSVTLTDNIGLGLEVFAGSLRNDLRGIVATDNSSIGVVIHSGSHDNRLTGSKVFRNGAFGVWVAGVARTTVFGNDLAFNRGTGIVIGHIFGATNNVIRANHVHDNTDNGISVEGTDNLVQGNTVRNNRAEGIEVSLFPESTVGGSISNTIEENTSFGNGGFDLADYPPGPCTLNDWDNNKGLKLYNGCETG